ncbi:MAG TPA: nickel-responsive transcriptional regulator NikR [Novimethylophilus sp.]|jgi:CopG family nickel-responsive transcriptional regulator|uniref:nickel-responsive transcriptional regulator NikR n=1 Tax=Novimethylophilus sp. TaxID=2137426 RepID=UPI002F3E5403
MQRFTISLDEKLANEFDRLIRERGYQNRSEAMRDLLRGRLDALRIQQAQAPFCVASLSYVYNHHERDLAERLTELQHQHHDLVVASTHVHLDHDDCLETAILRGATEDVRRFADAVTAQRGVRHGQLNLVPVEMEGGHHHHAHSHPTT